MSKKILITFLSLFTLISFISCGEEEYIFWSDEEISEITIVEVTRDGDKITENELCVVEDKEAFLADFKGLTCHGMEPQAVIWSSGGCVAIKISYENGEYELISAYGRSGYSLKYGFEYYCGIRSFRTIPFYNLVAKYFPDYTQPVQYDFLHGESEIASIEIGKRYLNEKADKYEYSKIFEIYDKETFLENFRSVECHKRYSSYPTIRDDQTVFKIMYNNGDYELIGVSAQVKQIDGVLHEYAGAHYFDKEQFNTLASVHWPFVG